MILMNLSNLMTDLMIYVNTVRFCFSVRVHVWAVSECQQSCLFPCGIVNVRYRVRVRVRVRDIIRYILPVYVVVAVTFSARSWDLDHEFERVTVRVATCMFSVDVSMHNHASVCVSVSMCVSVFVTMSVSLSIVVPVFMAMSLSVVVSETMLPVDVSMSVQSVHVRDRVRDIY